MKKKPSSNIDPKAPKPSCSAVELYQQSLHGTLLHKNQPLNKRRQSKYYKDMFQSLPPQEQDSWYKASYQDKTRYLSQLSTYIPPVGYDARGYRLSKTLGRIFNDNAKRDRHAPKRAFTPLFLFTQLMASQSTKERTVMASQSTKERTVGKCHQRAVSFLASAAYKKLDASEKARLKELCDLDLKRYYREMEEYIPPPGFTMYGKRESRLVQKPKRVSQPRTAFYFYKFANVVKVLDKNRDMTAKETNQLLKENWLRLRKEEKIPFYDMAKQDKVRCEFEMEKRKRLEEKRNGGLKQLTCPKEKEKEEVDELEEEMEELEEEILLHLQSNKNVSREKAVTTKSSCQNFYTSMATFLEPIKE